MSNPNMRHRPFSVNNFCHDIKIRAPLKKRKKYSPQTYFNRHFIEHILHGHCCCCCCFYFFIGACDFPIMHCKRIRYSVAHVIVSIARLLCRDPTIFRFLFEFTKLAHFHLSQSQFLNKFTFA